MASYVMKFLWLDQWTNFNVEDWDQGLVNFGRTTYRERPDPDVDDDDGPLPPLREPTPENGYIEAVMPLEAPNLEAAKQEAWRHWEVQPYRDEAQGYVIVDTMAGEWAHRYMLGWGKTPAGERETPPEPPQNDLFG
jgi:hypothetical protein